MDEINSSPQGKSTSELHLLKDDLPPEALASKPHPRVIFPSIEAALHASPFFIDEEHVGPWLSTSNQELWAKGMVRMSSRNAVHVPSMEPNGNKIPEEVVEALCQRAVVFGLDQIGLATGYWTLASTGVLQAEQVKIVYSEKALSPAVMRRLAGEIFRTTNQEAVAIEISGRVEQYFRD